MLYSNACFFALSPDGELTIAFCRRGVPAAFFFEIESTIAALHQPSVFSRVMGGGFLIILVGCLFCSRSLGIVPCTEINALSSRL